jgi:hypothetical protein
MSTAAEPNFINLMGIPIGSIALGTGARNHHGLLARLDLLRYSEPVGARMQGDRRLDVATLLL